MFTDVKIDGIHNSSSAIKCIIKALLPADIPHVMEIFYNTSHLWSSVCYKLYYARNTITMAFTSHINGFSEEGLCSLYIAWNKIQSAAIFNATFFYYLGSICWSGYR